MKNKYKLKDSEKAYLKLEEMIVTLKIKPGDLISENFISKLINQHVKHVKNYRREIIINQIVRSLINLMVVDVITTTKKNLKKNNPQSINDIYKQNHLIVDFSDKIKSIDMQIKGFLNRNE